MLRWLALLGALSFIGSSVAGEAEDKPLSLLIAMQQAMTSLNYQGTLAILKNAKLDTLHYFHTMQKGVEQERLVSLNSPLREVIRDADQVSCLFKAAQQVVIDHKPVGQSFLLDLPKDLSMLEKQYTLAVEHEAQVALQAADVMLIKPVDQFRYTRKYWIAKQSHLPLKIEVQDFTGETLEQVIFTDLRVVDGLTKVDIAMADKKVQHIHQFEVLGIEQLPFQLHNLPDGFEKRAFIRTHLHPSNKAVEQLLLSDGLSSVSVYVEKNPQNFHAGLQTAGAVNSLSRVIGDYSITVLGDVPAATVELIAQGIVFTEQ
ncbi:MAG: MucB/RseB C-terminal domain-containing protein [Methylococcaceae bacterium]